jgi:thermitase
MKRKRLGLIGVFFLLVLGLLSGQAISDRFPGQKEKVPGRPESSVSQLYKTGEGRVFPQGTLQTDRVLIRFRSGVSRMDRDLFFSKMEVKEKREITALKYSSVSVPEGLTAEEMLSLCRLNPDIAHSEPDYRTYLCDFPNDPLMTFQYYIQNTGQSIVGAQGLSGADMKMIEAWTETKGSPEVVVAALDTGVDFSHPDLQDNILSNGWDFVFDDDDPTDDHGHGTMVAGLLAADTNNNRGVAGLTWNCRVLPVKGIDKNGQGYTSWMLEAIIWAADRGVDVINLSVGADGPSQALEAALKYAHDRNIIMVSSAGNRQGPVAYPAAYDDYVLAVAASDNNDKLASFNNFGPEIDLAAPGISVFCCVPLWFYGQSALPYNFFTGTSIAVPHVSALAALIRTIKPWLSADQVMDIIRMSADDINSSEHPGRDDFAGYGRINMSRALVPLVIK